MQTQTTFNRQDRVQYLRRECAITKRRMWASALFIQDNGDGTSTLETTGTLLSQGARFIQNNSEIRAAA